MEKSALQQQAEGAKKIGTQADLESHDIQNRLKTWEKDNKECEKAIKSLVHKHPGSAEKHLFGVEGGDFDLEIWTSQRASRRLQTIKADQDRISKKINKKVMGMIEKAEKEYTDLDTNATLSKRTKQLKT